MWLWLVGGQLPFLTDGDGTGGTSDQLTASLVLLLDSH